MEQQGRSRRGDYVLVSYDDVIGVVAGTTITQEHWVLRRVSHATRDGFVKHHVRCAFWHTPGADVDKDRRDPDRVVVAVPGEWTGALSRGLRDSLTADDRHLTWSSLSSAVRSLRRVVAGAAFYQAVDVKCVLVKLACRSEG